MKNPTFVNITLLSFLVLSLFLPSSSGQSQISPVPVVGQKTMARSAPVVIASNQSPIPVTGTTTTTTVTALCTQTTLAKFQTVGVANGAGTSVTSTTSCIAGSIYVNNPTNSAATIRLQDKAGTPVIWIGGIADFSIPANSNLIVDLKGAVFTSGITAIAGTNAVLNLYVPTLQ